MNYIIVDALPGHVNMLVERLREADAQECHDIGLAPKKAIWHSFRRSFIRKAAFVDGEIAAMWGICGTVLGPLGDLWLMTTPAIERAPFAFIREAKAEVALALELFPRVRGILSCDYTGAVRLVKLLGFKLTPVGDGFAVFEKARPDGN